LTPDSFHGFDAAFAKLLWPFAYYYETLSDCLWPTQFWFSVQVQEPCQEQEYEEDEEQFGKTASTHGQGYHW